MLRWGVLVFLFYGLNACQSDPNSPHGVAERFLGCPLCDNGFAGSQGVLHRARPQAG